MSSDPTTDDSRWTLRGDLPLYHTLICRECGATYRGKPNECPHCQDGLWR